MDGVNIPVNIEVKTDADEAINDLVDKLKLVKSTLDSKAKNGMLSDMKESIEDSIKGIETQLGKIAELSRMYDDATGRAKNLSQQVMAMSKAIKAGDTKANQQDLSALKQEWSDTKDEVVRYEKAVVSSSKMAVQNLTQEIAQLQQKANIYASQNRFAKSTEEEAAIARKQAQRMADKVTPEQYEAVKNVLAQWDEELKKSYGDAKAMMKLTSQIAEAMKPYSKTGDTPFKLEPQIKQFLDYRAKDIGLAKEEESTQEKITQQVRKTASAMQGVTKAQQESVAAARQDLANAKQRTAATYYALRSAKMLKFTVDSMYKSLLNFDKALISAAARGVKALATLGGGFRLFHRQMNKATHSHNGFLGSLKGGFMTVLKYTLGIRSLYFLVNKLRKGLVTAMGELAQASDHVNQQMSSISNSIKWMRNMLATVAQPLLNVLVPAINAIANAFDRATRAVASFFATLTGQSFIYKAIKPTEDYAAALDKTAGSAKKAKDNLQSFDELHVISDNDSGGGGVGSQFEVAETEAAASELAKKVKDIFSTLFDPIKKAWDEKGQFVMDAWKYAIEEVGKLAKSVGEDFLKVWSNDVGVRIWENIFTIIGDVGLTVGNLASQFRKAWDENNRGYFILLQIQSIIDIIIQGLKDCADYTVEWSSKLDFAPLLESFHRLLVKLKEPIQTLTDLFKYFYENVVLKFVKYMVEDGGPKFLDVLGRIAKAIDWDKFKERLQTFMDAFEKFLELGWETFLVILEDVGNAFADLINSDAFGKVIDWFKEWVEDADPEELAKKIEFWAKVLFDATLALKLFGDALSIVIGYLTIKNAFANLFIITPKVKALTKAINGGPTGLIGAITGIPEAFKTLTQVDLAPVGTITETINTFGEAIKLSFEGALGTVGATIAGIVGVVGGAALAVKEFFDMWEDGWSLLKTILEAIGLAIAAVGAIILGAPAVVAGVVAAIVFAVSQIAIVIHDNWDAIKKWFSDVGKWISDNILKPIAEMAEKIGEHIKAIWDKVVSVFSSAAQWVYDKILSPIINFVQSFITWVSQVFNSLWIIIKAIFIVVANWVWDNVLNPILLKVNYVRDTVKDLVNRLIQTIKDVLLAGFKWFYDNVIMPVLAKVKYLIKTVKEVVTTGWEWLRDNILLPIANWVDTNVIQPVLKFFQNLWDGIVAGVKSAINTAIDIIERFINFVIDGINSFTSELQRLADIASKITGEDYSGIFTINHVSLPRLAQGAVIPPNKEFLALLGDQKSGTNIEAPLETIQDAVALVLQPYLERLIGITEDIYEKDTSVNIGDVEIAKANIRGQRRLGAMVRVQ